MRITIDLEPHEVAAANELLNSLKTLTDQLQIRTSNGSTSSFNQQLGQAASRDGSIQAMVNAPASGAPPGFAISLAGQATAAVQQLSAGEAAPSGQALPGQQPGRGDAVTLVYEAPAVPIEKQTPCYKALLHLTDASQVDSVAHTLGGMLSTPGRDLNEALTELVDAFDTIVFPAHKPGAVPDTNRVELYFQLLAHKLPDKLDAEFRKGVLQKVLRSVTKNRDVECERAEVLPFAVGFAMLARMECVKMTGALQTIQRLLTKPANCVAAVTMLGKTLSVCGPMVASAPTEVVESIWTALEQTPELRSQHFTNDLEYINHWKNMWQQNAEPPSNLPYNPLPANPNGAVHQPATGSAPAAQQHAVANGSTAQVQQASDASANQTLVLAARMMLQINSPGVRLAWDAPTGTAVVSGTDTSVCAWHVSSKTEYARLDAYNGYAPVECISTHASRGQMLLAANPTQQHSGNSSAYLALHSTVPGLPKRAMAIRHPNTLISSTLLLPHDESACVSCETWMGHMGANPVYSVCLWDIARFAGGSAASGAEEMRTLHTYTEGHTSAITCSAASPTSTHMFFSGDSNGTVRVWDTRMRQSAGVMCVPDHHTGKAHAAPVATMDTMGNTLITAGNDSSMCMWDLRQLGSNPHELAPFLNMMVEDPKRQVPIYKLAYRDGPSLTTAALATGTGLYLLDWTNLGHPTMIPTPGYHGDDLAGLLQHDIVWAPGAAYDGGLGLLGLGSQPNLTVFSLDRMTVHGP